MTVDSREAEREAMGGADVRDRLHFSSMEIQLHSCVTCVRVCLIAPRTRTRTQTTDHGPRTTDRVRHQTLLSNASDHGPSPTSQAKNSVCDFYTRTESEAKRRTTDRI
ncbi:hypothetical protein LXL04_004458 [Taraxacum kok-saghyz]